MRIWGKVIGAFIGLVMGGYVGALFGAFLGHLVDSAAPQFLGIKELRNSFFNTLFSVMGHVAKADGRVSEREIAVAEGIMSRMQLSRYQRAEAIRLFNWGKKPDFNLAAAVEQFYIQAQNQPALTRLLVEILMDAAVADGRLNPEAYLVLEKVCRGLAIPDWEFERLVMMRRSAAGYQHRQTARPQAPKPNPYRILGVEPSASDKEVKTAYRRLMSQHHPDKLVAQGLPKEMLELAKEKTVEIRAAYDEIREQRGMR